MSSLWLRTSSPHITDEFTPEARYDAVVVGAGLTGLATAVLLSRARLQVAVIEAGQIGSGTTGHSTAKLSLLQGSILSTLRRKHPDPVMHAYLEANREGQAWLLRYLAENSIQPEHQDAYTYAEHGATLSALRAEAKASTDAGLEVEELAGHEVPLPFKVAGALRLADQAQVNPVQVLGLLATELRSRGGKIFEQTRMLRVSHGAPLKVHTTAGELRADQLILATGTPVLDRGGYFARLEPSRSYAMAYRVAGDQQPPTGMFLSLDSPSRSIRTAQDAEGPLLLVGGNGHPVGRGEPGRSVRDLESWARASLPVTERTDSWSAQDYRAVGSLPLVGTLPGSGGNIHVATGFNKWGMTNAVAAALRLSAMLLGGQLPWAEPLVSGSKSLAAWKDAATLNAKVLARMAGGWASVLTGPPTSARTTGKPQVQRQGVAPVAVSPGETGPCRVSGVCTHLGGILAWNEAENTWDCPLHGSRFTAQGSRIEGPATRNLKPVDEPTDKTEN